MPRPTPAPLAESPRIGQLAARIAAADAHQRQTLLDSFLRDLTHTPLIEATDRPDECVVTFLWKGEAEEVLLFVNRITDERRLEESLMRRVSGTDLWHLSYRMRHDWRASYSFTVLRGGEDWPWGDGTDQVAIRQGLDRGSADPRNPSTMVNRVGCAISVVQLPGAPSQLWLAWRDDAPSGTVRSMTGPGGRRVWVHEPTTKTVGTNLPLVIVLDGDAWVGAQDLPTTLDNLISDEMIQPCITLFVDS